METWASAVIKYSLNGDISTIWNCLAGAQLPCEPPQRALKSPSLRSTIEISEQILSKSGHSTLTPSGRLPRKKSIDVLTSERKDYLRNSEKSRATPSDDAILKFLSENVLSLHICKS